MPKRLDIPLKIFLKRRTDTFRSKGIGKKWISRYWNLKTKTHTKNWQNSQRFFNYIKFSYIILFPKIIWYFRILPTLTKSILTFSRQILLSNKVILTFISKSWFYSFFLILLENPNPTVLLDVMPQTSIFFLYFFRYFMFFKSTGQSHRCESNKWFF